MPDPEAHLAGAARALLSLGEAVPELERQAPRPEIRAAAARGHFRPREEEALVAWFARLLTVREELWRTLAELGATLEWDLARLERADDLRAFALAYLAACLIVRGDRLLVEDLAGAAMVRRKLDEGSLERRIPPKQFTRIFESLTEPGQALLLDRAVALRRSRAAELDALAGERTVGAALLGLAEHERALDRSRRRYLRLLGGFLRHAWRRRVRSAGDQSAFAALESAGRLVAELRDHWSANRVTESVIEALAALLRPGDVLVTRHDVAMSNLFLPGYWPHAALYVGKAADRAALGVHAQRAEQGPWAGVDGDVLEALKDGVWLRPLASTLAVDAFAVIRPRLPPVEITLALERGLRHEGKLYNFDFDFSRSDRLVCTEVIYRAYDGLGPVAIRLRARAGRPTLSAEDLLDLAFHGAHGEPAFAPVAIFGTSETAAELVAGPRAGELLRRSYGTAG